MRGFIRELTSRRIAQWWLGHANDAGKSFGTKTREWEMDAVIALSTLDGASDEPADSFAFQLEFRKARLRTPQNAAQFAPLFVRPGNGQASTALIPGRSLPAFGHRGESRVFVMPPFQNGRGSPCRRRPPVNQSSRPMLASSRGALADTQPYCGMSESCCAPGGQAGSRSRLA